MLALPLSVLACKNDNKNEETASFTIKAETPKTIKITLNAKSNSSVSVSAVFKEKNAKVSRTAIIEGENPGDKHAIHVYEKADCSSENGTSTGGHWNPTAEPHEKKGDEAS